MINREYVTRVFHFVIYGINSSICVDLTQVTSLEHPREARYANLNGIDREPVPSLKGISDRWTREIAREEVQGVPRGRFWA